MTLLKPKRLKTGDTIGVVAPGGPPDEKKLAAGIQFLNDLGFTVKIAPSVSHRRGFLAGEDQYRAADVMSFFTDPDVQAIFAVRGGTGTPRILPYLDFGVLAENPKIFMGYSDTTVLQLALLQMCNMITFHGPMVAVDLVEKSDQADPDKSIWLLLLSGRDNETTIKGKPLMTGEAEGSLVGGCLSLIQVLCGTDYLPNTDCSILFWEDVGEDPYKLDRMLTQLSLCHVFDSIRAVLVGELVNCVPRDDEPSLTVNEILHDHFQARYIPVITDLPFGHGPGPVVLPLGIKARVDGNLGTVTLLDKPVSP